jgi:hypothetical protein
MKSLCDSRLWAAFLRARREAADAVLVVAFLAFAAAIIYAAPVLPAEIKGNIVILICPANVDRGDCSPTTAIDVILGPKVSDGTMCGLYGQSTAAPTALSPDHGEYQKMRRKLNQRVTIPASDAALALVTERVTNVESDITEIKNLIGRLVDDLQKNSRTPWTVIFTAIGVLSTGFFTIFTLEVGPLQENQRRIELTLEKMADRFMPSSEIERRIADLDTGIRDRFLIASGRRDDWQRISEKASERNSDAIAKLRADIVPRSEADARWHDLQRQLDEIKHSH